MLKEIERKLIERYKNYLKHYNEFEKTPSSCEAGHLQEISWILHELFGYTDRDIREIERRETNE
jgi:hypothetical protein